MYILKNLTLVIFIGKFWDSGACTVKKWSLRAPFSQKLIPNFNDHHKESINRRYLATLSTNAYSEYIKDTVLPRLSILDTSKIFCCLKLYVCRQYSG